MEAALHAAQGSGERPARSFRPLLPPSPFSNTSSPNPPSRVLFTSWYARLGPLKLACFPILPTFNSRLSLRIVATTETALTCSSLALPFRCYRDRSAFQLDSSTRALAVAPVRCARQR